MRPAEAALIMSDDRLLAYLSGAMTAGQRRDFEAEMARDPELRKAFEEWILLAQARQLTHNDQDRPARLAALMQAVDSAQRAGPSQASERSRSPSAQATQAPPHAAAPSAQARPPRSDAPGLWARLRGWVLGESAGPMAPLGWVTAAVLAVVLAWPGMAPEPILTRGADTACARLHVDLPDDITMARLRDTLTQYGVALVSGPDAGGGFVLAARRDSSLRDAAASLGVAASASLPAGACPAPTAP